MYDFGTPKKRLATPKSRVTTPKFKKMFPDFQKSKKSTIFSTTQQNVNINFFSGSSTFWCGESFFW